MKIRKSIKSIGRTKLANTLFVYLQEYFIASFQIVPMFLLLFECRVTNVSKLYGAYDSIGMDVVSFGEFLSLSNPKKCSTNPTRDFFLENK